MGQERDREATARRSGEARPSQTEGTVKNDRGTVQFDEVQLSFCHITAPITGRVGLRLVDPGNVVTANAGTTLAVITQLEPISIVFTVSEDDLGQVLDQANHGAQLPVLALDRVKAKQLATGTLITVDNQIDTTTGTVKLRALFDNKNDVLFPNQFVNTRLLVRTIPHATTLPSSAIQHDSAQAFVYVIANGRAHVQKVKTGITEGGADSGRRRRAGDRRREQRLREAAGQRDGRDHAAARERGESAAP